MGSGLSEVDIYNLALDMLVEDVLVTPTDDRAVARLLRRNFAAVRDALLEQHDWNFAVKRASLPADSDTPAFEWSYQYTMPADLIRILPITSDGTQDGPQQKFTIESGKILINVQAPLLIRYIWRNTVVATWSPSFCLALSHALAARVCYWVAGKQSLAKVLNDSLPGAISKAQMLDSVQGVPDEPDDSDVINVR